MWICHIDWSLLPIYICNSFLIYLTTLNIHSVLSYIYIRVICVYMVNKVIDTSKYKSYYVINFPIISKYLFNI